MSAGARVHASRRVARLALSMLVFLVHLSVSLLGGAAPALGEAVIAGSAGGQVPCIDSAPWARAAALDRTALRGGRCGTRVTGGHGQPRQGKQFGSLRMTVQMPEGLGMVGLSLP